MTLLLPAVATLIDGSTVTVNTSYPFEDTVRVSCVPKDAGKYSNKPPPLAIAGTSLSFAWLFAAFPLLIRVPSWSTKATLNGKSVPAGAFSEQTCTPGGANMFTLKLAPEITVERWAADQHGGVAVHPGYSVVRGPLLFSLPIAHNFTTYGRHFGSGDEASNDYYLSPTAPWSFALNVDPSDPTKTLTFAPGSGYVDGAAPFNRTGPLSIKATARLVNSWNISLNSAAPPPESPACAKATDCGAPMEITVRKRPLLFHLLFCSLLSPMFGLTAGTSRLH